MTKRLITMARFAPIMVALASSGCARLLHATLGIAVHEHVTIPAYELRPVGAPAIPRLRAGVSRVDITPPPGFPTGGHGPAGDIARGYWLRLYARAFFFSDLNGHTVVFVSCDLFAMPAGLKAQVARRVALKWNGQGVLIPPEAIVIGATHTHQGPGNYLTSELYNGFGSVSGGFSRPLFDFLVDRIALAIDGAIEDARNGAGDVAIGLHVDRQTRSFLLNRSPRTFLLNWNAQTLMNAWGDTVDRCEATVEHGEAHDKDWDLPGCPRLRAIDPTITALDVQRDGKRLGVLVFMAVHPTVLDHGAPIYDSDMFGYAVTQLEREASPTADDRHPVIAVFNGAEGDIVPLRGVRDVRDVAATGLAVAAAIRQALSTESTPLTTPSIVVRERTLRGCVNPCADASLAPQPLMGAAALGGGEDDRTVLYQLGWQEGQHDIPQNDQGPKLGALDAKLLPFVELTQLLGPPTSFPQELPLTYVELGTFGSTVFSVGAFPVEISSAQAADIRGVMGDHGRFEIIGLANEYSSYVATIDEYAAQDYMAASTIWGPHEGAALKEAMQMLAQPSSSESVHKYPKRDFDAGPPPELSVSARALGVTAIGEPMHAADDGLGRILLRPNGAPERNLPQFEWCESVVQPSDDFEAMHQRRIEILTETRTSTGTSWIVRRAPEPDDDRGKSLLTVLREASSNGSRRWAALWLAPILTADQLNGTYKFRVTVWRHDGSTVQIESVSFSVPRPTPPAPVAAVGSNGCR